MSVYLPSYGPEEYGYEYLGAFCIPGKCRTKSNEKLPFGRLSTKMRVWEEKVALLSKVAIRHKGIKTGWLIVQPYFENLVHPDLSNLPKSIFDGVVKGGVFKDDKLVACTVLPAVYKQGEKTEVFVWAKLD